MVLILNRKSNSEKLEVVNDYNSFFTTTNYVNNFLSYSKDSSKFDYEIKLHESEIEDIKVLERNAIERGKTDHKAF